MQLEQKSPVLIRGAGEMASAVAWTLHRAGFPVVMTELPAPLSVRRLICFSEAARLGSCVVEGERGILCRGDRVEEIQLAWNNDALAVLIDDTLSILDQLPVYAIVDARMRKRGITPIRGRAPVTVALGPAVIAGEQVDLVIETQRGNDLGRVIRRGEAIPDTGIPGEIGGEGARRLCRAPAAGVFESRVEIGALVERGETLGVVGDREVTARISGMLRGLVATGTIVRDGEKVGDVDPRGGSMDPAAISDKGHAVAAGVLNALRETLKREEA